MKRFRIPLTIAALTALGARGGADFDAGADLRIREELTENVPGLPNGGVLMSVPRSDVIHHMRFRARVWGDVRLEREGLGKFRLYTRFTDECRWYVEPKKNAYTFPDEVILDNLYLEGKGLFDDFLDFSVGRQDLFGLYGLDHVFVDGTPGDGSRTTYGDMVRACLRFTEATKLDLFAIYNKDDNRLRWGTERGDHRSLTGFGGGAEPEMDDWGFGAVLSSDFGKDVPYQLFLMQKNTDRFYRKDSKTGREAKHPRTQRELMGFKTVPRLNDEWSLQFEGMSQVGENGRGDFLTGWSAYSGVNWKRAAASSIKPFGKLGYHFMSGDDDAATEDGGHSAWDPMWARGVNDSELFLYGTHYGAAWWSNQHYLKLTLGLDFGPSHKLAYCTGPMFAAARDGMGGGDGSFKGYQNYVRYDFPLLLADKEKGERFEMVGHVIAEFFNPGDYFETEKPAYFLRWQVELKF